jgi:general stress protein YciG
MSGTPQGGRAAAETNKKRYGKNYYEIMGRKGGTISRGGGFAANPELASVAGKKGGKASRRGKSN